MLRWADTEYSLYVDTPDLASDARPLKALEKDLQALMRRWEKNFDGFAEHRARWFAERANVNTTNQLRGSLRDAGLTVKFRNSRRVMRALKKLVGENTDLIKSIPREFLGRVNDLVMKSVRRGRDMGYLKKELKKEFEVTERRAITIARDQTNKATEAASQARCEDIGITHGFWLHRGGGKVPRATHQAFDGQRFELSKGLYDEQAEKATGGGFVAKWVRPAELVNCHCSFKLDTSTITSAGVAKDCKRRGTVIVVFASGSTVEYAEAM